MARRKTQAASRSTTRSNILLLVQTRTQATVARMLRVSDRTVRRWKNEGVEPANKKRAARLQDAYRREADAVRSAAQRDHARHRKSVDPRKLPVLRGERRLLKERKVDPRTGEVRETGGEFESSWINYNVRGLNLRELHAILVQLWRAKRSIQFIYEIPKGGRYPLQDNKPGRVVRKKTRTGTAPIPLWLIESESELLELLMRYVDPEPGPKSRRMLYIAVDDNAPGRVL